MKKILITVLLLFFVTTNTEAALPAHPPLPKPSLNEKETVIVFVKDSNLESTLKKVKEKYPFLQIKNIYKHVFKGFSVYGTKRDLVNLAKEAEIAQAHPVVTYQASVEESVPFIGGNEIRGMFDLHDRRITGKGVKVGVIDTGIDYHHPDLKRNYEGGYDFVDHDTDPMETRINQGIPTLHGTHVAGIIAANGRIRGVAPDAEIIAYRALGPGGVGTSEQVIAAIDRAIEQKIDILNLSLGNTINGPDWPTSIALNKAVDFGIIAVVSSGNSGPNLWTVGSPGTASKAISVGASSPPLEMPYLKMGFEKRETQIIPMHGSTKWDFSGKQEITFGGFGKIEELKKVKGKVVLLERGKIPFMDKVINAQNAGAIGVIIFNNQKGSFTGSLFMTPDIPAVTMSKEDGIWVKQKLYQHINQIETLYKHEEDQLADFSSRGPVTHTWEIKPDIVAPGIEIDSTIPKGYLALHGTSMAAPHVAGACALIKQAHPSWTPVQVKAALMNTAKRLVQKNGQLYPPYAQGTGRIQLKEAIAAKTLIYPSSLTFGLIKNTRKQQLVKLTIDNQSLKTNRYSFGLPARQKGIHWKVPIMFTLKQKEKRVITVTADFSPDQLSKGFHHGYLTIIADGKPIYLPYLFLVKEPNYPRVMSFAFFHGDKPDTFKYELYLPGGADEMGIALYDPVTFRFIKFLDFKRDVPRGLIQVELQQKEIGLKGTFKALVFAKKAGKEDTIETSITIDDGE